MRRFPMLVTLMISVLAATAARPGVAQVKQVEMDIAGYLCGF